MLYDIPIDKVNPTSWKTLLLIYFAASNPSSNLLSLKSKNASSIESGSTSGVISLNILNILSQKEAIK